LSAASPRPDPGGQVYLARRQTAVLIPSPQPSPGGRGGWSKSQFVTARSIEIRSIPKKEIVDFARRLQQDHDRTRLVPITSRRAGAHGANPWADAGDPVLYVAYDGRECVGYLGQLPAPVQVDGRPYKVMWPSTIFVHPPYRGRGLGRRLAETLLQANPEVVITGANEASERTFLRAGARTLGDLVFCQIRWDGAFSLLERPAFNRVATGTGTLSRAIRTVMNRPRRWLIRRMRLASETADVRWVVVPSLLPGHSGTEEACATSLTSRNMASVHWMIRYPWVAEATAPDTGREGYHFAQAKRLFRYVPVVFEDTHNGTPCGFMVFLITFKKKIKLLRMLDYRFRDVLVADKAIEAALSLAERYLVDRLEFGEDLAPFFMKHPHLGKRIKKKKRPYYYAVHPGKTFLERGLSTVRLHYCDGDMAFN